MARATGAIVLGEARALDVLTIDPVSGEFAANAIRRRRGVHPRQRSGHLSGVGRGCTGEGASEAVARRNETLMRFAQGTPSQRLVWRCEKR